MLLSSSVALALALGAPLVRPSHAQSSAAADRTTWQGEAQVVGGAAECVAYSYAPLEAVINGYPTIWQTANASFA